MSYQIYMVGGAVRDELLGKPVKDRDWVVVGATSNLLLSEGYLQVGKDFPVFLHPETKEEYALARTERKQGHGYGGFEVFATPDVTLEEDLLRRDLTINAMAKDDQGNIVDPYRGQNDLNDRLLRHVSEAFEEDPLRVLRLARFYARFYDEGFKVADETKILVHKMIASGELSHLVPERIWLETHKALSEKNAVQYFMVLHELGALAVIFPMLAQTMDAMNDMKLKQVLAAVTLSIAESQPMYNRVAILLSMLQNPKDVQVFAKAYRLSSQEKVMAEKLNQWKDWFDDVDKDSERYLALLLGLDAFRKNDQWMDFLTCMETLKAFDDGIDRFMVQKYLLLEMYDQLHKVDVNYLISGVLPKNIPDVIRKERLRIIENLIKI